MIGLRQFRAHRQRQAVAELCGLAPSDVSKRMRGLPEWNQLIARTAGVVRDDNFAFVEQLIEFVDHAIGCHRALIRGQLRQPFLHPLGTHLGDGGGRCILA